MWAGISGRTGVGGDKWAGMSGGTGVGGMCGRKGVGGDLWVDERDSRAEVPCLMLLAKGETNLIFCGNSSSGSLSERGNSPLPLRPVADRFRISGKAGKP